MTAGRKNDKPPTPDNIVRSDLMLEIVRDEGPRILSRRHFVGEASITVDDANLLLRRPKRFLRADFRDFACCEGMIRDERGTLGHHEQEDCIRNGLAIQSAELTLRGLPSAEAVFAAHKKWKLFLELALVCIEEATSPPK